jgi:rSAM/selenodomain-associated transferase 1
MTALKNELPTQALIIFVKNPQLGKVKTRLAKTMGEAAALDAYLQMLAHVRAVAQQVDAHRAVYYSDYVEEADAWSRPQFSKHVQAPGELGDKMRLAIEDMMHQGYAHVVLVGSDLLDLQVQHLEEAFRALRFQDFVLGPAIDGGYYLIGMNEMAPTLFADKAWSTDLVLESTLQDIRKLGKTVHLLRPLSDIDEEKDWLEALARHQARLR